MDFGMEVFCMLIILNFFTVLFDFVKICSTLFYLRSYAQILCLFYTESISTNFVWGKIYLGIKSVSKQNLFLT